MTIGRHVTRTPTPWTRRLQVLTAVCSVVFTTGTVLHGWLVITPETLEAMMRLSGRTAEQAAAEAPGFLVAFRAVAVLYVIGNALGVLALRGRPWTFWLALLVNVTQAAGPMGMIPPVVYRAAVDTHGVAGLLPTLITDGGALLLSAALIAGFLRFRTAWAHRTDR
ncbi:hypothetical protein [Saccharothrix australiensis]|uniref:Uncharacterized protein n=1 Tax=Saccharothrix australiensis TaxID=2072 RepID=A0A495W4G8_9PSEU|nr:hypothetical protein [Saccharothrix australiensis]RKT55665.1 hypothetical protein C8E97_4349 [Saccharothrix australiensis]